MDLGEKITTIADKIYNAAVEEFTSCNVSVTLAAFIMDNVNGKFQAAAYKNINAVRAAEETERERRKVEDAVKEMEEERMKAAEKEETSTDQKEDGTNGTDLS